MFHWATRLIAFKDLRLRVRDRSFFIMGILAPLGLAFIFNLTFGGVLQPGGLDLRFGYLDLDGTESSSSLGEVLEQLEADDFLELTRFDDREAAAAAVEDGDIQAFILVPEGFDQELAIGAPKLEVVGDIDSGTATDVASAIARQFGTGVDAARLAVITTASIMGVAPTPDLIAGLTQDPATAAFTANITGLDADIRQLDGVTYITAGMAIFFLFFTVQAGVLGLLDEEREGTLRRLMAAPVPRAAVIGGKGLLALILGVFALTTLVVASSLIMGASWGHPLGVAIMILTGVAAAVSLMGVVAGLAKSPEGAENLASITAVILGMLGGVFFPIESAGGALAAASVITPHYWFLRGLGDLAGGAPWTNAFPAAAVLIGMAVVLGLAAGWVLNRRFAE